MEFFKIKRDIPFMRYALVFNVISALTFVAAVYFLEPLPGGPIRRAITTRRRSGLVGRHQSRHGGRT